MEPRPIVLTPEQAAAHESDDRFAGLSAEERSRLSWALSRAVVAELRRLQQREKGAPPIAETKSAAELRSAAP